VSGCVMDDLDRDNLLVLTTFAGSVVAVIVVPSAWRAKRTGRLRQTELTKLHCSPKSHAAGCSLVAPILNY